ncbi:MAG: pseudouridine synthase [Pseudomonadota bacterium]
MNMPRLMTEYCPPEGELDVLHEDPHLVFVDKPSGLLSVPGKPEAHWDCVEYRVRQMFPGARLIHRLDLETSGVMVFARSHAAQKHVNRQFERRDVQKAYIARVAGQVTADAGVIDLPLIADWPRRPMQKVCHETGRPARTRWQVLEREDSVTRLELLPETGRSHQLRVHLSEIGHPILGDPFYAPEELWQAAPRLQLHASSLALCHPETGSELKIEAHCPF